MTRRAPACNTPPARGSLASRLLLFALALGPVQAFAADAKVPHRHALPALESLAQQGVRVSARVIEVESGRTLAALNPAQALIPASVTKLYTAAAALDRWGAAKRFKTRVVRLGPVDRGVLHGDLVFVGGGDPGLTNAQLWALAQRVREAGIATVDGRLLVDPRGFGPVPCVTPDRCHAKLESEDAYNAPLSSAGVDYSNACLSVRPGDTPGAPARLAFEPFDLPMLTIQGHIETRPPGSPAHIRVVRRSVDGREVFEVSGSIPLGGRTRRFYRSIAHPDRYAGEVFRAFLEQAGVAVRGGIGVVGQGDASPPGVRVAEVKGTPLGEQLRGMLVYSNNYMADILALDWAAAGGASVPVSLPEAGRRLTVYARKVNQDSTFDWAHTGRPLLESGSGLTVGNRLSANDVTALLAHEYHRYGDFPAFLAGLTVPDQTPVAMLKGGDPTWDTRIAAKTGSLNQPVSVFALAGYLRLKGGRWGAFAVLVNGSRQHPHVGLFTAIAAVRSDLQRLLAADGVPPR